MEDNLINGILMSNFVTVYLVFGFALLLFTGNIFEKKVETLFGIGVICVSILIIVDIADSYFSHQTVLNEWRYWTSALGYTIRPIAIGIFISILLRKDKTYWFLWLPVAFEAVLAMTNKYTHLMFYFDVNNGFHRGPFGFLPHILSFSYMFLLAVVSLRKFRVTDLGEMLIIFYVIAVNIISVYFETVHSMKYLLTGAIICSITVYYTYLYVQTYKIDQMTDVFNRRTFYVDTEKKYNKTMAIICIDLNNLKTINDNYGHSEGDIALTTLSKILIEVSKNKYRIYRMGGDEFFVIGTNKNKEDVEKFIASAKNELSKTKYSASFGHAMYLPEDDFEKKCILADESMYEDKKRFKESVNQK